MHAGPRDAESHFKVTIVSAAFESLALLARHRAVNAALADELKTGIHALSITARTPKQWEADQTVAKSPACLGGQQGGAEVQPCACEKSQHAMSKASLSLARVASLTPPRSCSPSDLVAPGSKHDHQ